MNKEREILEFQVLRCITKIYKSFLTLNEDLKHDHANQFEKLKDALPEHQQIIAQAEFLDDAQFNYLRKKILDIGNEGKREIISCMENFEINFKK